MHRQVAGPTAAAVMAAVRGEYCVPGAAPVEAGSLFFGVSQVLGEARLRGLWSEFQLPANGRANLLDFPDFIANRSEGRALPSLADLARFDLSFGLAAQPGPTPSIATCCLPENILRNHPEALLRFQPGWRYLSLNWPVHRLDGEVITAQSLQTLAPEFVRLRIAPNGMGVSVAELDPAAFELQVALRSGKRLREAGVAAATIEPTFDPFPIVAGLVESGAIMDVVLHPVDKPNLQQPIT